MAAISSPLLLGFATVVPSLPPKPELAHRVNESL
jgi:hypothetical protein